MKNKMIEQIFVDEKKYFIITPKGREFLLEYNKIQGFVESFGLQV
jgi:predicted transcriptional regulator